MPKLPNLTQSLQLAATLLLNTPALAQHITHIDGLGDMAFVTVGNPGNRGVAVSDTNYGIFPEFPPYYSPTGQAGRVDYTYRISQTPITYGQWFGFADAFSQVFDELDNPANAGLYMDTAIDFTRPGQWRPIDPAQYGLNNHAAAVGLEYAAMYINWLHNGQAVTRDAFLQGVYDTSTFVTEEVNGETVYHHDFTRSADARFWIPSLDEILKAAYFDPHSTAPNGDEGRWWHYANQSDSPLTASLPGEGGEMLGDLGLQNLLAEVGLYPETTSAYGLLDVSGVLRQRTLPNGLLADGSVYAIGDNVGSDPVVHLVNGHLVGIDLEGMDLSLTGFRIAAVPAPTTLLPLTLLLLPTRRRR